MLAITSHAYRPGVMTELSERTKANMDVVLEETCRQLPHGGDHDSRKFIAERLIEAAQAGHSTLGELGIVARRALAEIIAKGS
ncbi:MULTISPECIES: hypothetical protein [Bradyrhizobium]|uniref:Bsl6464 protein n=4 Tax=Bradyrhizobium diazoefficiens TaxID=1355477 RepID=Q89G81_BRADU|nr:hypothetical protein AAV28_29880 [Bradyrhizobium diazoefficiens USDA 110]APO51309.1 hypothetical protein BD122_13630 [Bradyrhizobium diazoefficiens]KGJ66868.1 hypothetical protein BJA5080_03487 [Bradyrhizobium diazoefficiens SEMIA 5080]MDA9389432.1 hypothetical protein [Bradyrhizobium sp. CCBAU 45394]MDA9540297.1 hypothetical protein [Bradyrhizobium sp. CCBAU 21362]QHP68656.1 hypothetical protein EI171_16075 [Bradyrhizobium sp. LCT2]